MKAGILALMMLASTPALAVEPDEILPDAAMEARARALSQGLRCLVCRNENIDDSHADLARDLRIVLRERLVAGDTDETAMAYMVDRYGEYVLLNPTATGANLILWLAGPTLLLGGGGVAAVYLSRWGRAVDTDASLTPDEASRLDALLTEDPRG